MGLSFFGCVVVASAVVVMTAMAVLGACLSMWLMEKFLTFMAEETMPPEEEILTDCTQSCKEMGMMTEGCDYCR